MDDEEKCYLYESVERKYIKNSDDQERDAFAQRDLPAEHYMQLVCSVQ